MNDWPLSLKHITPKNRVARKALELLGPSIERALGITEAERLYRGVADRSDSQPSSEWFVPELHRSMRVSVNKPASDVERIPTQGPLVVVANHPYGGIEATILLELVRSIRPDVKFLANYLLAKIPETRDACIYVDPFDRDSSVKRNLAPMRESISWVRSGGALCIFPAGTVSHYHRDSRSVSDPEWNSAVGRIIRKTRAPVLPVFFLGRNGAAFQVAGMLHETFRTLLLIREFCNKQGKQISVRVGNPIAYERMCSLSSDAELVSFLRLHTYALADEAVDPVTVADRELPESTLQTEDLVLQRGAAK